jgi:hypothetical protein
MNAPRPASISVVEQSVGIEQVSNGLGGDMLQRRIPRRSLKSCRRILPIDIPGALDAEIGHYETRCFADVREALERPTEISCADRSGQPGRAVQGLEIEVPRVRLINCSRPCFHRDAPLPDERPDSRAAGRAVPEGFDHPIAQYDRIATAFLRQSNDALCHQHHGWVAAVDQSEFPKRGLKYRCEGPDIVRSKGSCLRFQERPNWHEQPRKPGIRNLI